ncbi:YbaB/EbfC family nucleoid-associated protein [Amycolatopsis sp. OK19-0408]|uniref:YbaB/EbfC family nucleoid-associated protein n=1 Tax=Amycolatopsis iheyensis TaxID=2945988 RepID=A0A9X2SJW9_9PSEU|nr:YbaB/EbfC family nucleoid-associated protein [Amycolatopsis iheyensis]MCR6483266.1 YbaB/EbfC family nucleoid-associated protein [Amycolatopsis iheyensis]
MKREPKSGLLPLIRMPSPDSEVAVNPPEPPSAGMPDIARRAAEAKARLERVSATASSADGAVTVTVNTSGALQELTFGPRADELPRARLAQAVLAAAKRAQVDAAQQLAAVMAPVIGADSDAMHFLREQIPTPELPEEEQVTPPRWEFTETPRETPPPPPPPVRPARPRPDDDEDFGGPILRRGL